MKVIALETGYHGGVLRYESDEFDVPEGSKASWYVSVAAQPAAQSAPKPSKKGGEDPQQGQHPGGGLV